MSQTRRNKGIAGEDVAAAWYLSQGYEIVARNWRCRTGELDLIVRRGPTLVFCEVKSRSSLAFGAPAEVIVPDLLERVYGHPVDVITHDGRPVVVPRRPSSPAFEEVTCLPA